MTCIAMFGSYLCFNENYLKLSDQYIFPILAVDGILTFFSGSLMTHIDARNGLNVFLWKNLHFQLLYIMTPLNIKKLANS